MCVCWVRREVCLCLWQCVAGADVVGAAHTHTHRHRLSPATRNKREEGAKQQKAFGIFIVSPLAKWRRADKLAADRRKLFGSQHELRQLCLPACPVLPRSGPGPAPDASSINQRVRAKRTHIRPVGPPQLAHTYRHHHQCAHSPLLSALPSLSLSSSSVALLSIIVSSLFNWSVLCFQRQVSIGLGCYIPRCVCVCVAVLVNQLTWLNVFIFVSFYHESHVKLCNFIMSQFVAIEYLLRRHFICLSIARQHV